MKFCIRVSILNQKPVIAIYSVEHGSFDVSNPRWEGKHPIYRYECLGDEERKGKGVNDYKLLETRSTTRKSGITYRLLHTDKNLYVKSMFHTDSNPCVIYLKFN